MKLYILLLLIPGLLCVAACNTTRQHPHNQNTTSVIHGKRWILARFADTAFSRPEKKIYLLFEKDSLQLTGFAGCNGFRGSYRVHGQSVEIGPVAATKMWCNHAPTESYFISVLDQTDEYRASDDSLSLMLQDHLLAVFYAEPIK